MTLRSKRRRSVLTTKPPRSRWNTSSGFSGIKGMLFGFRSLASVTSGSTRLESCAQKRSQVPPVNVFVRRLARSVMTAGQYRDLVIKAVPLELFHDLAGEFRQKGQIVSCIDDEGFFGPSRELLEVRHRANRQPCLP